MNAAPPTLMEALEKVLLNWAFLSCENSGPPVDGPAPMELERMVKFRGEHEWMLVLRGHHGLGMQLYRGASGQDQAGPREAEDAFQEFSNLVSTHLGGGNRAGLPVPSQPQHWPKQAPDESVALLIGRDLVEARLWRFESGSKRGWVS